MSPETRGFAYYCAQNTLSVTSSGSFTFSYQTQYQFTVDTDPSGVTQVTGGGWFPAGTSVQTSQASQVVAGSTGTQYAFKGWQINGTPQSGNPISITLDKPYTAIAKYTTQYQLAVVSAYGNPQGSGFYDAGSTAQFSVTTPSGFPIQQIFVSWQGDFTGTSAQGSITMDKPHTVQAVWSTELLTPHNDNRRGGRNYWRSPGLAVTATSPTRNQTYTHSRGHPKRNYRCSSGQVR